MVHLSASLNYSEYIYDTSVFDFGALCMYVVLVVCTASVVGGAQGNEKREGAIFVRKLRLTKAGRRQPTG